MVPTASNGSYILTQGFQQPSPNGALALNANLVSANASCAGSNDGFGTVSPAGGSAPYSYQWSNNPQDAFGCDLPETADRYARLQLIENYTITEHQFL